MRGFMTNFEADPVVDNMKKYFKSIRWDHSQRG